VLQLRSSLVSDGFDSSASDNLITPSKPISLPVLSENEMNETNLLPQRWSVVRDVLDLSASDNFIAASLPKGLTVWS
jgi:hypothetical protein